MFRAREVSGSGFKFRSLPAVCFQANHLTFLCLSFLKYKMGTSDSIVLIGVLRTK